jgi:hypothetical protein
LYMINLVVTIIMLIARLITLLSECSNAGLGLN